MSDAGGVPSASEMFRAKTRRESGIRRASSHSAQLNFLDLIASQPVPASAPAPLPQQSRGSADEPLPPQTASEPRRIQRVPDQVWTVSHLLGNLRGEVEGRYKALTVEGEVSNWRKAGSGHCYFTLKDADAQIAVVMFRREAALLRFSPKDGDGVRLRGDLTVYEARGQMQLVASSMHPAGRGAILLAVEELKERLGREGLFARKRPLPAFPRCIGVVTSTDGAALRDIVKVCRRRHAAVNLLIYPAAVQGPRCAEEVAAGVQWFSAHPERADVLIVGRGGGAWEELHGFNDERVVRAIAACAIPVISAVGHATDTVLADSAADLCAPTPSAAAELVTAAHHTLESRLGELAGRLLQAVRFSALSARAQWERLGSVAALRQVHDAVRRRAQAVDDLDARALAALRRRTQQQQHELAALHGRLLGLNARTQLRAAETQRERIDARLDLTVDRLLRDRGEQLRGLQARLEAMSPLRVLKRGYSLIFDAAGELVRDTAALAAGDRVTAQLASGRLQATVDATSE